MCQFSASNKYGTIVSVRFSVVNLIKHSTIVIYDSIVVLTTKIAYIATLGS